MSLVVAFEDIKPEQVKRSRKDEPRPGAPARVNTSFFRATSDNPDIASAYMSRWDPGQTAAAHFHVVDQFQIIIDGKGQFGRHDVSPYCIHFSRAYTPYGPLRSDDSIGWTMLALRTRFDYLGEQNFPESAPRLREIPNHRP